MKPYKYVTTNNKGGVGKTTVAHYVTMAHDLAGLPIDIIEVDEATRLSEIYPKRVTNLPISPSMADLMSNGEAAIDNFMPLHQALRNDKTTLIDLGASATKGFLETADLGGLGEEIGGGHNLVVFIVTTTDQSALASAHEIYSKTRRIFPFARVGLVFNEKDGPFADQANLPFFKTIQADQAAELIVVPAIKNQLVTTLYNGVNLGFDKIISLSGSDLAAKLQIDVSKAKINHRLLQMWVVDVLKRFGSLLPSPNTQADGQRAAVN